MMPDSYQPESTSPSTRELHHMVGELIKSTRMMKDDIRSEMQNTNEVLTGLASTMNSFVEQTAKQMDKIASQKETTDRIERRLDETIKVNLSAHDSMIEKSADRHDKIDTRLRDVEEQCSTNTSFIEIQKNKLTATLPTTISVISALIMVIALFVKGS